MSYNFIFSSIILNQKFKLHFSKISLVRNAFDSFDSFYLPRKFRNNGNQLKNPSMSGVIFTLSLRILIVHSQCEEGAREAGVLKLSPVILK